MARQTRIVDADYYAGNDYGYYQRTNLQDMIDNFMIAYVGNDKILMKVPRYEVAFHMQRCIQEFNYDIFHSEKEKEFELGPSLQLVLPSDYVNVVSIHKTAQDGRLLELVESSRSTSPQAVAQDQDYNPLTDQSGNIITTIEAETIERYQSQTNLQESIQRNFDETINDGEFYDGYDSYNGRKYGLTPSDSSGAATYIIDKVLGVIFFDSALQQDDLIILKYISDGLENNADLSKVFVPKLAEDAVYANVLYNLAKVRQSAQQAVPLFKKEAKAKMNNAKIRLMDFRPAELKAVLRNKTKWIKH